MKSTKLFVVTFAAFVLGIFGTYGVNAAYGRYHQSAKTACKAGPGEICPPPDFVAGYHQWESLKDEVDAATKKLLPPDIQMKKDELVGMSQRLAQQIPAGYTLDQERVVYVMQPRPPAAPVQPATPAVPEAKK